MALIGSFRVTALAAFSLIGGFTLASAQCPNTSPSFSPDFSATGAASCFQLNPTSGSNLPSVTNAGTLTSATVLQLTPSVTGLAASAWYTNPQPVASGFTTTFSFQIGDKTTDVNADGIAFVVQNSPAGTSGGLNALGSGGGGIGYAGIPNSLAIEFNTFPNAGDPNGNDVTIHSCAQAPNAADSCAIATNDLTTTGIKLADPLGGPGVVHTATVVYSVPATCTAAPCSTIDVILDGVDLFPNGVPFDITTIGLTNSAAYVGFTAGTGADDDEQDIESWTFSSSQTQTSAVPPDQSTPTTFDYSGGFTPNNSASGYNFSALQTNPASTQTVQMTVTAIPMATQAACNAIVRQNLPPNPAQFPHANCFVYQNGAGPGKDAAVMFEVTCTQTDGTQGSCGANSQFFADLGTQFSFTCTENPGLTCPASQQDTSGGSFGFGPTLPPHLTSVDGLPSIGFLKGEGPDPAHPCTPGASPLFTSNQIEAFKLGDTSGGAKGGSGGTTSCWVMTYLTQAETPSITMTQPTNGTYAQNQSVITDYKCAADSTGDPNSVAAGPYLTIPPSGSLYAGVCAATNSYGGTVTNVGSPSQVDTSTLGPHTFTVQAQDSAMNTNQTVVTYTVVATPASGTKCNGVYNGTLKGNLTVSAGQTCIFIGGGVTGNVAVNGGSLSMTNATVTGNFQAVGGSFAIGPGTSIKGNFSVVDLSRLATQNTVCGSAIGGNLSVVASFTPTAIGNGTVSCPGNTITGSLSVTANAATTAIYGNTVGGSLTDSANLKPTQVFSNKIKTTLTCTANVSITGGGNTAGKKTGQCASF